MTVEVKRRYEFEPLGFRIDWPPLDYRRDDYTTYDVTNITTIIDVPPDDGNGRPTETTGSTMSWESVGVPFGENNAASQAWQTANLAIFTPFCVGDGFTAVKLWLWNGAAVSGNVDVGLYSEDGTRLVSSGSTAQSGVSVLQVFDIADTAVDPVQRIYIAVACDNTTARTTRNAFGGVTADASLGVLEMTSAFPLPATATMVASTRDYVPVAGYTTITAV